MPSLIDTSAIETQNQSIRDGSSWQTQSMRYCTTAIDVFDSAARVRSNSDDPAVELELSHIQALGIRCLNSLGAASDLMIAGYYQQSSILIRDLMECSFLLDLFSRGPEHLRLWIDLGERAGTSDYKPVKVRELLEGLDGNPGAPRRQLYQFYSREAVHPNSDGVGMISPNGITMIGPFSDADRMIGLSSELTKFAVMAAQHLCQWIVKVDLKEGQDYQRLGAACEAITFAFMTLGDHLASIPLEIKER